LGGFIGFLDRSFRHHDYLLGRLNCQRFLMRHFYVDMRGDGDGTRGLFLNMPPAYQGSQYFGAEVVDRIREQVNRSPDREANAPPVNPVPVIPLMPHLRSIDAAIGSPSLLWPHYDRRKLDKLQRRIQNRMDAILETVLKGVTFAIRAIFLSGIAKLLRIHPAVVIGKEARVKIAKALDNAGL
jgi:hypothetical protein